MLEPIQQPTWSRPDRRAWGLGLTLLLLAFVFATIALFQGRSWTYRTDLEYIPKELTISAYEVDSDLMEFGLGLPDYAIGASYVLANVLPEGWIYPLLLLGFILAVSLLAAGASYLSGTFQYGALAAFAIGITTFSIEVFNPLGFQVKWFSAIILFFLVVPIYLISNWLQHWNLARRWWVLILFYGLLSYILVVQSWNVSELSLATAQLWFPLLIGSLVFIILNATDVLQGVLTLVTREENSKQSWMHFSIFSTLYLANFILIYLRNTGQFVIDIFYLNPFLLQGITIVTGLWMLTKKSELVSEADNRGLGFSAIYISLAAITLLTIGMSFALANDLMIEVLEDAICLINFCMGVSFFLYVVINYFQLMGMGLRVHLVMFKPRYMPVFAIPVFGLGGVLVFMLNVGYFPYYQVLSAKSVLLADQAQHAGDNFLAENYLKNALNLEDRNQRSNLSLAGLYFELGNPAKAQEYAEASLTKWASAEAYLSMSQGYRHKNLTMDELLILQEGLRKFPENGTLLNNIGIAFSETKFKDSAEYYLSKAAQSSESEVVGKANLGFYYLVNKLETEGLPKKSPEQQSSGNWAQLNNSLVFANIAHEKSPVLKDLVGSFQDIPESIQPFVLFHSYLNKAITRDSSDFHSFEKLENDSIKKFYKEPLLMAKAMLMYRNGMTQKGIETLLGLYESTTSDKLDITLLLGKIYYEQAAYQRAAYFFRQAAGMGVNKAMYWYALSCLDAGNSVEAAEALKESLPYLNPADKVRVTVLIDGLKSGEFHNAAQRSDPEKSAYIKVNWNKLNNAHLKDLIYLTSDKESQRFLWLYAFRRAYRESMRDRCVELYKFGNQFFIKNEKWRPMLADAKPLLLEISGNAKGLETWIGQQKESQYFPFLKARLAQLQKRDKDAIPLFEASLPLNPLNTRQTALAIGFLSNQPETKSIAYQKSLEVSDLNPADVEYLKLYALLAVKEGVADFAYQMLIKIENQSSKAEALAFKAKLDAMVKEKYGPEPSGI